MKEYKSVKLSPLSSKPGQKTDEVFSPLEKTINKEAESGWRFEGIESVPITKRVGCLAAVFGKRDNTDDYYMLLFSRGGDEIATEKKTVKSVYAVSEAPEKFERKEEPITLPEPTTEIIKPTSKKSLYIFLIIVGVIVLTVISVLCVMSVKANKMISNDDMAPLGHEQEILGSWFCFDCPEVEKLEREDFECLIEDGEAIVSNGLYYTETYEYDGGFNTAELVLNGDVFTCTFGYYGSANYSGHNTHGKSGVYTFDGEKLTIKTVKNFNGSFFDKLFAFKATVNYDYYYVITDGDYLYFIKSGSKSKACDGTSSGGSNRDIKENENGSFDWNSETDYCFNPCPNADEKYVNKFYDCFGKEACGLPKSKGSFAYIRTK